jgi:cyanophycinase
VNTKRSFALLGSGEFEPWSAEVDRFALGSSRGGDGTVLILPTASAPEGDEVFDGWAKKGLDHFASMGIASEVLPLKTRHQATVAAEMVDRLRRASVVYFSGGNPAYLARTLVDTRFWAALLEELDRGLAYVGCSAGVAILGEIAPDSARTDLAAETWTAGLRLFPLTVFGPHWNMLDTYVPGISRWIIHSVPDDCQLVGIDERTAMAGSAGRWRVMGKGEVSIFGPDRARPDIHSSGATFTSDAEG